MRNLQKVMWTSLSVLATSIAIPLTANADPATWGNGKLNAMMRQCSNPWDANGNPIPAHGLGKNKHRQTCYRVSGQVVADGAQAVTLQLDSGETVSVSESGNFSFVTPYINGESYQVAIASPDDQQCQLVNNSGTFASADFSDVYVSCTTPSQACSKTTEPSGGDFDLSGNNIAGIESVVANLECGQEPWRVAANQRIEQSRKAQQRIQFEDKYGNTISNANVKFTLVEHEFEFGSAVQAKLWHGLNNNDAAQYRQTYLDFGFNKSGFQNALKYKLKKGFAHLVPDILTWLAENDIPVRGHTLIWPGWQNMETRIDEADAASMGIRAVAPEELTPAELKTYVDESIKRWASQWSVDEWDVANELRDRHDVQDILGYQEEAHWFNLAKQYVVNPEAVLYLNDNRIISDPRPEVISAKVSGFKQNAQAILGDGGPLEALGFQSRYGKMTPAETIYQRLSYFDDLGLPIAATEFEMKDDQITSELERAEMTARVMTTYFSKENVNQIIVWTFFEDTNRADERHIVNIDGTPNLRGKTWLYMVKKHWNTDISTRADRNGEATLNGFKGRYQATVRFADYPDEVVTFTLGDDTQPLVVRLPHYVNGASASVPANFAISNLGAQNWEENKPFVSTTPMLSGDDTIGAVQWQISGGKDADLFSIDADTGVLSMSEKDYENPTDMNADGRYEVVVTVIDQAGNSASQLFVLTVTDVYEPVAYVPPMISGPAGAVSSDIWRAGMQFIRPALSSETDSDAQETVDGLTWAKFDWQQAVDYCASIEARLPTATELANGLLELVNNGDMATIHNWPLNRTYWSITEVAADKHNVMKTNITPARISALLDNNKQYVSCVR